ncbi:hypothetical protein ACJX0J_016189, partial [Zea mays]
FSLLSDLKSKNLFFLNIYRPLGVILTNTNILLRWLGKANGMGEKDSCNILDSIYGLIFPTSALLLHTQNQVINFLVP